MLQELSIQNFAIIPKLNISFEPGMTVLTGETGAGKSIIIDAVGLLTGGRGSQDYIRQGADKSVLQGLIDVEPNEALQSVLESLGIPLEDNQLLIHRELHRNGRNVIRVNNVLVNATALKSLGRHLVDIHGQNEHQALMQPEQHLGLLDEFAQKKLQPVQAAYQNAFKKYQQLNDAYHKRQADEQAWAQRLDMLSFQSNELNEANLVVGEEEELETEYQELSNFQDVLTALSKAYEALEGEWENNGLETVGTAVSELEDIEELAPRYTKLTEAVRGAYYELQEAASEILNVRDNLAFDEERLRYVDDRLNLIRSLEKKYGATITDVLKHQQQVDEELMQMGGNEENAAALADQLDAAKQTAQQLAQQMHDIRSDAAVVLTDQIHEQLKDLYMDKAIFSVKFMKQKLSLTGQDGVEFYIQTNLGESAKPLAKIASGGELSRMMLAMKTIFSREQGITSIIFDEVDTGVSGRVAQAIAEKIAVIGRYSQVLTITHLPQVAAIADHHFFIEKQVIDKRTETSVRQLAKDQRIDELARMLSGNELTTAAKENARDLLKRAHTHKNSVE
ncbi:DNA repair protein RecN [Weissella sagaensis]|uniref:DNA repair protein RecN n=1 Tax=Weissella sagaensis TaxID=2559928 RepID=A0ABW1RU03_9LACO|nr:DNA repair protein RecN [Weissella sagaensis]KAA8433241.1 DNA repair protein RecN [Weissella paramesenteroides]QDJ59222.1 DNA repair protein RecN [Weissella hellenica]KAA8439329.1 DNA repair protein RecN [Weissella paramesenteroides]QEA56516.1 DNA repair protein RecN [Weissella hellenica]UEG67339.1 DNA repair protein RecN [Weissella hellenica]